MEKRETRTSLVCCALKLLHLAWVTALTMIGAAIAATAQAALDKLWAHKEEKEKPKWEQVNMEKRMKELGMSPFLLLLLLFFR